MKIESILSQHRRDFTARYICEHCGFSCTSSGYDDDYFHRSVIPAMACGSCGKKADENYRPLSTKYKPWEVV